MQTQKFSDVYSWKLRCWVIRVAAFLVEFLLKQKRYF